MPLTEVLVFRPGQSADPPLINWLNELERTESKAYSKCLARILMLHQHGHELRRPSADILRDGIHELRIHHDSVNYRILYFFSGKDVACLAHGITKEKKVPDAEIDRAVQRKKLVEKDRERYTAEWEF
jgi:hypothetical protein